MAGQSDVCLLLEGTYPFVSGGVSSWVHDLISGLPELTFSVVCILPEKKRWEIKYDLPANLVELRQIYIHHPKAGRMPFWGRDRIVEAVEQPLAALLNGGTVQDLDAFVRILESERVGKELLLDSNAAWRMMVRYYETEIPNTSFLDFFWTWRFLVGSILSTLSVPLPKARCYHAVSTGYAGLMAAKAKLMEKRPTILTEHGIYTNERRIEVAIQDWLYSDPARGLNIENQALELRDIWMRAYATFSKICYGCNDEVITLYDGNQELQVRDGAPQERCRVVPNGIDFEKFSALARETEGEPPTVALIGRVVPIKDVKTFIRAVGILQQAVPSLRAWVMGPTDEDEEYFRECQSLVASASLDNTVEFLGRVNIQDYLGKVDVIVLTSVSEAQPLVILEAGAAGVPCVSSDVGACYEMIYGTADRNAPRIAGGEVVPVASPAATAKALERLLTDPTYWQRCSDTIRNRVYQAYRKDDVMAFYRELYLQAGSLPDGEWLPSRRSMEKKAS